MDKIWIPRQCPLLEVRLYMVFFSSLERRSIGPFQGCKSCHPVLLINLDMYVVGCSWLVYIVSFGALHRCVFLFFYCILWMSLVYNIHINSIVCWSVFSGSLSEYTHKSRFHLASARPGVEVLLGSMCQPPLPPIPFRKRGGWHKKGVSHSLKVS
jgi:hypothetical protein